MKTKRNFIEDDLITKESEEKYRNETDNLNYDLYKSQDKIIKNFLKAIPSETLINELKRRKLLKFNWIENKYNEIKKWKKRN